MPSDTASSSTSVKRLSGSRDQPTVVSHSPSDSHSQSHSHKPGAHKHQRHVVGHSRLGARNPSFGRNLSKINTLAANSDDGARREPSLTPVSPRPPRPGMKRNQSLALMPRTASQSGLRKNHSSGHLARNSSAKHLSKSHRPEHSRTTSHPDKEKKSKRKTSPATNGRQPAVHFDMGDDDDDAEEMEGVDDGWTEESASQSPSTTRDNTRSNTRRNSAILDTDEKPIQGTGDRRGDTIEDTSTKAQTLPVNEAAKHTTLAARSPITHDFATQPRTTATSHARKSSYHDTTAIRPPDAEAIAKRLLQRGNSRQFAAPQLSDVSVTAYSESPSISTSASNSRIMQTPGSVTTPAGLAAAMKTNGSSGSGPLVSRFIDPAASGSKDNTPLSPSHMRPLYSPRPPTTGGSSIKSPGPSSSSTTTRNRVADSDMRRNQSVPAFGLGMTNGHDHASGTASGSTTPGGTGTATTTTTTTRSRTEQKLWLQRGLSNIEANSQSQSNLVGMGGTPGGGAGTGGGGPGGRRGGAAAQQAERVERELVCVRRYRGVVEEGISRVRRVKGGPLKGVDVDALMPTSGMAVGLVVGGGGAGGLGAGAGAGPAGSRASQRDPRSSLESGRGKRSGAVTPAGQRSRGVSPIGSARGGDTGDWDGERVEDLEEVTLGFRRRMWELMEGEAED